MVRTFSRVFPSYHPRAGEPTYFAEQFLNSLEIDYCGVEYRNQLFELNCIGDDKTRLCESFWEDLVEMDGRKHHTIRAGNSMNVYDKFSPRIWTGKPYHSKQLIIAPDVEIKKIWNIDITLAKILNYHRMKI